jgi:glycosyltransferase involved in cell wall biosynthesis
MNHVSIIIPLANAAKRWPEIVATLQPALQAHHEVVVVDNASRDNTATLVAQSGVKVVSLKFRTSDGVALQAGVDAAKHDTVLLWDVAQTQNPAEDLAQFIQHAKRLEADVLQGVRTNRNLDGDKSLLALMMVGLARHASDMLFTDPASPIALCRKSLLERLGIQNEELRHVALVAASRGAKVAALQLAQAPLSVTTRRLNTNYAIEVFFEFTSFLVAIAWTLFKRNPLRGFGVPAMYLGTVAFGFFVLAFLSLLAGVFVSALWLAVGGMTFIAVQLLAIGLMGEVFKRMKATYAPAYILGEASSPSATVPVVEPTKHHKD